jgi:hypothetical protein
MFDTLLQIYSVSMNSLIPDALLHECDDCGTCAISDNNAVWTVSLEPGVYYLNVEGYAHANGTYVLNTTCGPAPPLMNITKSNPTVVGDAYCGVGHYMGNTMNSNNTIMNSTAGENWYMFTAPMAGQYRFNTCNSSFDTHIYLFSYVDSGMQGNYSSMIGSQIGECDSWFDIETPTCHTCDPVNEPEVSKRLV